MDSEKNDANANSSGGEFKRVLGPAHLIMLGVGVIVGAGIFVITGQAAAKCAGPALILSFLISGVACAFTGLCYAEFASMMPVAGSAYTYARFSMGKFVGWIIGWNLVLEYLFGVAFVASGWSEYLSGFLGDIGLTLPAYLSQVPLVYVGNELRITGNLINLPAMLIILLFSGLLVIGIRESAKFNFIIVMIKIAVILLFVGVGMMYINPQNWHPFIPPNTGEFGHFGWSGVLRGAGMIFLCYIGFDVVSSASQEVRNPQKNMAIGIMGSLAIATALYILTVCVMTGIVSYTALNVGNPVAVAIDAAGSSFYWIKPFIKIGIIAGLSSGILVLLLGQPRILYKMASDGLLPEKLAAVHPKFKTPHIATLANGFIAALVAGLCPLEILGELVSIGTLMAFMIVCVGIVVLRHTRPDLSRPFKTPLVPFIPIAGALISLVQMIALPGATWIRLGVWVLIGLIIYWIYEAPPQYCGVSFPPSLKLQEDKTRDKNFKGTP